MINFNVVTSWATLISLFVGLASLIYAIYCNRQLKKKEIEQRTINWEDVNIATKNLAQKIERKFKPDVIYIPSIKSGIIVYFFKDYFKEYIPIIAGQTIFKKQFSKNSTQKIENSDNYLYFETKKWYAFVPKSLLTYKDKNLLIIDDFAMSGDFLEELVNVLIQNGFTEDKIITSCLATTDVAVNSEKAPTFYWKQFPNIDIYLPWGKPV